MPDSSARQLSPTPQQAQRRAEALIGLHPEKSGTTESGVFAPEPRQRPAPFPGDDSGAPCIVTAAHPIADESAVDFDHHRWVSRILPADASADAFDSSHRHVGLWLNQKRSHPSSHELAAFGNRHFNIRRINEARSVNRSRFIGHRSSAASFMPFPEHHKQASITSKRQIPSRRSPLLGRHRRPFHKRGIRCRAGGFALHAEAILGDCASLMCRVLPACHVHSQAKCSFPGTRRRAVLFSAQRRSPVGCVSGHAGLILASNLSRLVGHFAGLSEQFIEPRFPIRAVPKF